MMMMMMMMDDGDGGGGGGIGDASNGSSSSSSSFSLELVSSSNNNNYIGNISVDSGLQSSTTSPYVQALMYVMYITISVAAIGGNGIVCYIVIAYQKMRTVTNFFIVNLAIGDILMASLCIPFTFVANLILMYWPFGAIMCPIVTYAQAVTVFISAYTMVAISIDRYIAILYPLRPRMTKLQAKLTILVVWMVALGTPLPTAIKSKLHRPDNWNNDNHYVCTEVWETNEQNYCYSMILMVLQYVFPLCALIFTYARIAFVVWGKRAPGEAEDSRDQRLAASKRKMVKMMITVVAIFTLCWLPFNTLLMISHQDDSIWSIPGMGYVWFLLHWLAMSHSCCNPIIYCWMNARFREGFRRVFRFVPCIQTLMAKKHREECLKRCNTYTTSYTSVRTTSIHRTTGGGQRLIYNAKPNNNPNPNRRSSTVLMMEKEDHNNQTEMLIQCNTKHQTTSSSTVLSSADQQQQQRVSSSLPYEDDDLTNETRI